MVSTINKIISNSRGNDSKLIQDYILNKSKEHCEVIGPDCERCSVSSHCVHKKEKK